MPITLTVPEDLLSAEAEAQVFAGLTNALLKAPNSATTPSWPPMPIGSINVLPKNHIFAAGAPTAAAFVELKLPAIALATPEAKQAFIEKATDVVERAAKGCIRRDHIWTNIVYAADGAWGIEG